jgi:peptide/nickel transport system substrate-binding protein
MRHGPDEVMHQVQKGVGTMRITRLRWRTASITAVVVLTAAMALQAAPAAPQRGGTLVVIHHDPPPTLDPSIHFSTFTNRISQNTHDPLVHMVDPNNFVPGLAERWEISPDHKTFTFHLRRDVRFHDGTPLTAEAVKATWERSLDPANRTSIVALFGTNPKITVVNPQIVRITFDDPNPRFLQQVALPQLSPGSPTAWARMGREYLMNPVGAGPFKVEGWRDENTLILARNADYRWGPSHLQNRGPAYVDRIIFRIVREEGTRSLALERGQAHIAHEPARAQVVTWRGQRFRSLVFPVPGLPQVWPMNQERWPTNILAVRQAMQHAINRERLVQVAHFGTTTPAYGPLVSNTWGFWPEAKKYYPFNRQKARELLEGAGFKRNPSLGLYELDGRPLRVRLVTSTEAEQVAAATVAQAQLREIGVEMVVEAMDSGPAFARYESGDYELGRQGLATVDPDSLFFAYHSVRITQAGASNRGRIRNAQLDGLLERGRTVVDPEQRRNVYFQAQKLLLDMANAIYTYERTYFTIGLACVHGFRWTSHGYSDLREVWIDGDCRRIGN